MIKAMFRFVIKPDYVNMLLGLEFQEKDNRAISKETGMTIVHLNTVLNAFVVEGVLDMHKSNGSYKYYLTEKGKSIIEALKVIKKEIGQ